MNELWQELKPQKSEVVRCGLWSLVVVVVAVLCVTVPNMLEMWSMGLLSQWLTFLNQESSWWGICFFALKLYVLIFVLFLIIEKGLPLMKRQIEEAKRDYGGEDW